ncbi:hypothetical protein KA005_66660, partial [bacterium]|nr:hypothetical protein [bacterium]
GDNIKVYVARGSHANYLRSFSGKLGVAGDNVGDNGKILKPGEYTLKNLENQLWLDYRGRWGECGNDITEFASAEALGQNGPLGPKYGEGGAMWDDPISWGKSIPQANDLMFMGEWFLYNFVLIFILLTILSLALTGFFIYRRHKKHGLGPRIVSLLYIDGANLKSIGNILCIVGIIVAIIGLFHPWYEVSYDISEIGGLIGIETTGGMQNLMKIDGIDGVQISIPGEGGPMPLGTVSIPFSLLIGISLVFLVIATIGISHSKKLGWKYSWRGVRLLIPVILILIVIIALGSIIPSEAVGGSATGNGMSDILSSISSSPFGGQKTFYISYQSINIPLLMQWGLGLGAQLLLMAGIIILVAGILEFSANTQFFTPKLLHQASAQPIMPYQQPPTGQQPSQPFSESP